MKRSAWIALFGLVAALWPASSTHVHGQGIKLATDRPQPNTPEKSAELFRLPNGLRVEVVASEPHLADPVAIDFDAQGRIFVAELHGYNLEGYWDIVELNKGGVLDTEVRRIDATEEAVRRAEKNQYGTVKLLEDTDGDGRIDKSSVWADRLLPCYGVVAARGGVIAVCPPDILFLADRDGDGKAEIHDKLFSTGSGPMWNRPSNPRWNVDNWIYFDGGSRFKPDGSVLEPATGSGQFGQAVSDWGDRFFCVQVQPALFAVPLPHRYLIRNPYHPIEADTEGLFQYKRVYPTSRPHPWRVKRSEDPAWMEFYGAAEATANGFWTAACGPEIYRATELPPEYYNNYFICENAQNFVNRNLLERDGAGYRIRRIPEDEKSKREFLTSTEQWFRPVNLTVGPDGALYIVDMYREIIEDYSAIPRFLQQQYVESLIAGGDRGRIYRIVARGAAGWQPFDLNAASASELVDKLSSSNVWWRQTAQRLLVERSDRSIVEPLVTLIREGNTPQARLHALHTLAGLDALRPDAVKRAIADPHFAVRLHALRLSETWLDKSPELSATVLALGNDPDPAVRLQFALTLGQSNDPRAVKTLAQLAMGHGDEKWMPDAILSSAANSAAPLLDILLDEGNEPGKATRLIEPLAAVIGARQDRDEMVLLLKHVAAMNEPRMVSLGVACMDGFITGLKRGSPKPLESAEGQTALAKLMGAPSAQIRKSAMAVAGLVKLQEGEAFKTVLASASAVALNARRTVEDRTAAIYLLRSAPFVQLDELAEELLDSRNSPGVQMAMIHSLAASDSADVAGRLLANWQSYTPKIRQAAVEAILGRKNRLPTLLDAIQQNKVPASALTAMHRIELTENPDPDIRLRARSILTSRRGSKDLEKIIPRYHSALSGPHDTDAGKVVFEKQCSKCHKLNGEGFEVGPDLATVINRADQTLVSDVLEPSSEITVGFEYYSVVTDDGRIFSGVLAVETATSIRLRKEEGVDQTILRNNIDEMAASPLSMMPEEMEKEVTPEDLANLIAYLRHTLGPAVPTVATLFDDDPGLVKLLTDGAGVARMEPDDWFSGKASLAVTPPQRYSERLPGWAYQIAETPSPGQFRYIRFAWKSRDGSGVMIELAANGAWPPADKPLRRYYSGRNTTDWEATEVSDQPPRDWVVVTRDLWKDFGSFTLTGIAPTAMGGEALFDRIELLRTLDRIESP